MREENRKAAQRMEGNKEGEGGVEQNYNSRGSSFRKVKMKSDQKM